MNVEPLHAAEFDLELGHWAGDLGLDRRGRPVTCTVSLHNLNDEMLIIRAENTGSVALGVFGANWEGIESGSIEIVVMADHDTIRSGQAFVLDDGTVYTPIPIGFDSLEAISDSQFLSVISGQQSIVFDLEDAAKAVDFLRQCEPTGDGAHSIDNPRTPS